MTGDAKQLSSLYREVIINHAAQPIGHGRAIDATHRAEGSNPLCGDRIVLELRIEGDRIVDAAFEGEACAICLASASLLCTHLPGRAVGTPTEALAGFRHALQSAGIGPCEPAPCPDFLAPMLGVRDYPARIACATLPWETAVDALGSPVVSGARNG